jgi:hypothetical protein
VIAISLIRVLTAWFRRISFAGLGVTALFSQKLELLSFAMATLGLEINRRFVTLASICFRALVLVLSLRELRVAKSRRQRAVVYATFASNLW